jgi:hypothetical protein
LEKETENQMETIQENSKTIFNKKEAAMGPETQGKEDEFEKNVEPGNTKKEDLFSFRKKNELINMIADGLKIRDKDLNLVNIRMKKVLDPKSGIDKKNLTKGNC